MLYYSSLLGLFSLFPLSSAQHLPYLDTNTIELCLSYSLLPLRTSIICTAFCWDASSCFGVCLVLTKESSFGKGRKNLKPDYTNSSVIPSMNQTASITQITDLAQIFMKSENKKAENLASRIKIVYRISLQQPSTFFSIAALCSVHHPHICRDTEVIGDICITSLKRKNKSSNSPLGKGGGHQCEKG